MKTVEVVVRRNTGGEIVRPVGIEITRGECRAEPVPSRGNVEAQVLAGEALGAERGESDTRDLGRGGARQSGCKH